MSDASLRVARSSSRVKSRMVRKSLFIVAALNDYARMQISMDAPELATYALCEETRLKKSLPTVQPIEKGKFRANREVGSDGVSVGVNRRISSVSKMKVTMDHTRR